MPSRFPSAEGVQTIFAENVSSRRRAACLAHVRRNFFDALRTSPLAQQVLDLIAELYRVEDLATQREFSGAADLELRKRRAGPIRKRLKAWLDAQSAKQLPKGPLGTAIRYALGQWDELGVFLTDPAVPLDNNASERSLRRIALGRKNYLFVGDVSSGESLAGRYSLVALARVQDQPASAIAELLPGAWAHAGAQAIKPRSSRRRSQGGHPCDEAPATRASSCVSTVTTRGSRRPSRRRSPRSEPSRGGA